MDETTFILGFVERIEGAVSEEKNRRYRNAVELYYKATAHLVDYLLSQNDISVDTLKQRLELINKHDIEISNTFRAAHKLYRLTYRRSNTLVDCKQIKNGIKTIAELSKTKESFKEGLEKI